MTNFVNFSSSLNQVIQTQDSVMATRDFKSAETRRFLDYSRSTFYIVSEEDCGTIVRHHKLAGYSRITQMDVTVQQIYFSSQMASDVISTVRDCRHRANAHVRCWNRESSQKPSTKFEPLDSVAIDTPGATNQNLVWISIHCRGGGSGY